MSVETVIKVITAIVMFLSSILSVLSGAASPGTAVG